ncbi:MAG: FKBP-type peptidyl-prolyl cis-trans isomerase, partial [Candidatus Thermoplasmatota archaeon]|nr:FKBP-type peptidyl-prolyl cis-trans isomerase [Candidatus Thermoplasmatota archaeon]
MGDTVEQDTVASVHYTGTFVDGVQFDSSEGKDPLVFLVGHGQMIPGFEQEVLGAKVGEKREFTLTPDRAY